MTSLALFKEKKCAHQHHYSSNTVDNNSLCIRSVCQCSISVVTKDPERSLHLPVVHKEIVREHKPPKTTHFCFNMTVYLLRKQTGYDVCVISEP